MKNSDLLVKAAEWLCSDDFSGNIDMSDFRRNIPLCSINECDTVGCFLGWCPYSGVKGLELIKDDLKKDGTPDFGIYCYRVFDANIQLWDFLFSEHWNNGGDKPHQLLQRAKYVHENGGAPDGWERDYDWHTKNAA